MADLVDLIDALDRLVASSVDAAPPEAVEEAARVARRARARRGYLGDTVVVALAGGTGSGKSSLVNALAGEEVAPSGAFRPTTSKPLAWMPADPEPGLVRLLDDLGIEDRVGQDVHEWLAVIDLPDTDSVELEHRLVVERLLPEVDAVIWVVDPEKYQDRILHAEHLAPLAAHADQFIFALNQVDRVAEADVPALVEDLRASLASDGISDVPIVTVAADPDFGDPIGIDELILALRGLGEAKSLVHRKIVTDLEEAATRLSERGGVEGGGGTGFSGEWEQVLESAAGRICDDVLGADVRRGARRAARVRGRSAAGLLRSRLPDAHVDLAAGRRGGAGSLGAVAEIDRYVSGLATRVGGDVAADIRAVGASVDDAVSGTVDAVSFGESLVLPAPPGWAGAAAWARRAALLGLVVAIVWLVDGVRSGGELLVPVAVVLVAVLVLAVPGVVAGSRAERAAMAALDDQRDSLVASIRRELDRRLGRPLREALRKRAGMSAALTEFEIVRRDVS